MHTYKYYQSIGAALLIGLTLAACSASGPASPEATAAPAAQAATAPAAPTQTPISSPQATAIPGPSTALAPTALPATAEQPSPQLPATPWPDAILPPDVPWIRSAGKIFADDEALDFQQRGLSIPEYRLQVSPGGAHIAYVNRDGMFDLIDVRGERSLLGTAEKIGQPTGMAFSPDGHTLALTLLDQDNTWRLRLRDIASGNMLTLLEGSTLLTGPNDPLPLIPSPVAWTPNGVIVEHLLWGTDAPPRDIALVNPVDGSKRMVREGDHVGVYPAHAGTKIAVVIGPLRLGEAPTTGIVVLDATTSEQHQIRPAQPGLVRKISWSPDDQKLLYAVSVDYQKPEASLHTLNADGSNEQAIEIGAQGVKAAYADIAWRDAQTALLLSPESDGYAHLYELPIGAFDITGLQPIAAFMREQPDQPVDQIIYTPN